VVIQEDGLLCSVAIPPFVLGLEVDVGVVLSGVARLSNPWWSPNPYPSDIFGDIGGDSSNLVGVDVLLERQISIDAYESLLDG